MLWKHYKSCPTKILHHAWYSQLIAVHENAKWILAFSFQLTNTICKVHISLFLLICLTNFSFHFTRFKLCFFLSPSKASKPDCIMHCMKRSPTLYIKCIFVYNKSLVMIPQNLLDIIETCNLFHYIADILNNIT